MFWAEGTSGMRALRKQPPCVFKRLQAPRRPETGEGGREGQSNRGQTGEGFAGPDFLKQVCSSIGKAEEIKWRLDWGTFEAVDTKHRKGDQVKWVKNANYLWLEKWQWFLFINSATVCITVFLEQPDTILMLRNSYGPLGSTWVSQ